MSGRNFTQLYDFFHDFRFSKIFIYGQPERLSVYSYSAFFVHETSAVISLPIFFPLEMFLLISSSTRTVTFFTAKILSRKITSNGIFPPPPSSLVQFLFSLSSFQSLLTSICYPLRNLKLYTFRKTSKLALKRN